MNGSSGKIPGCVVTSVFNTVAKRHNQRFFNATRSFTPTSFQTSERSSSTIAAGGSSGSGRARKNVAGQILIDNHVNEPLPISFFSIESVTSSRYPCRVTNMYERGPWNICRPRQRHRGSSGNIRSSSRIWLTGSTERAIKDIEERSNVGVFFTLECDPADIPLVNKTVVFLLLHTRDLDNLHNQHLLM